VNPACGAIALACLISLGSHWVPVPDSHLSPYFIIAFQVPFHSPSQYLRLSIPGLGRGARLWLDSAPLLPVPDAVDEWLIPNLRSAGSTSHIAVAAPSIPAAASLLLSPRVYLAKLDAILCQDHLAATAWVRNTLDNTVNVSVALAQGPAHSAPVDATVPPGMTQSIPVRFPITAKAGQALDVIARLEKAEEAMEAAYAVTSVGRFFVHDATSPSCH